MTTIQDPHDPLVPLTLRLSALEAQVKGVPLAYDTPQPQYDGTSITRRVIGTEEKLERIGSESDALKRLLGGYEGYKHLLNMPGSVDEDSKDQQGDVVKHEDLLPDNVKLTMLLEARGDIISAERDLREIERLKERGVEGGGQLEELLGLKPQLKDRMEYAQGRSKELNDARREVGDLLRRYNGYTGTVSDLFLELHHRLEAVEEGVRRAEKLKRDELKERY